MIKKALVGVIAIIMVVGLMPVQKTSAATVEELQALIMQLQAQLAALSGGQTGTGTGYQFTKNLTLGSKGTDVIELQKILIAGGYLKIAAPTGNFLSMTKAAVVAYQKAMGISPTSGYVGALTRAKLNGTGGGVVVIPTDSYLKVEAAGPAAATIPDGSIYNPVLKLKVSAGKDPVTITGLTVTRGGYIANTYVTGVSVWDDMGNRYGNILTSLTSDGKASFTFGATPFTVPAGTTKYLTVAANIDTAAGSGTISFSVDSATMITATGGTVIGTFPVVGNVMTIVDGASSLGDVRVSYQGSVGLSSTTYSSSAGNVEVGYTDQEIAKIRFVQNNSKEGVYLNKLTIWVGGSFREATDLKNFKLLSQDGAVVATADRAYDRYVTFNLATPYFIDKGYTRDFTVKTDVADGSGNYFYVTIQNDYDVVVKGATTGASILAVDSNNGSLTSSDVQNDATGWFKIKQGVATVSKASSSPSGNIAPGSQSIVLARFEVKSGGEALEVRKMGVRIVHSAGALGLTGTVLVKDATTGATYLSVAADTTGVGSTTSATAQELLDYQQNLSSYISIPSGQSVILEVVGSISQSASSGNYTAYIGQLYAKRLSTNDYVTLAATANQGNTLTVKDVTLSVTKDASYANTTLSVGAQNVKIGQFVLKASSADDVRVNTINIDVASSSNIQNLKLMDGSTQLGTTKGTPTEAGNSFSLSNYVLAKDTPKTISIYADILSSATGTVTASVSNAGISGVGVSSGKSLSSTPSSAVALQQISFAAPTLTIARDAAAPTAKIILAGQSGVELHKIRFEAKNEDLTLKKITFVLTSPSTTVWNVTTTASNFTQVYLYDGSTLLGQGTVNSQDGTVSISGVNVTLGKDTQKVLTLKVDVSPSGTMAPVKVAGIKINSSSTDDMEIYSSTGLMSDGITVTSDAASNYMLYHDAAPSIVNALSNATKVGQASDVIGKFTITNAAPAGGRTMTISTSTITVSLGGSYSASSSVTTFKLYDESDTLLASGTGTVAGNASTSKDIVFGTFTTTQEIAAGSSKTYTLKADTTNIRMGVASGSTVNLVTKIGGTKGYTSTYGSGPEYYWNTGNVVYSYTPANGGVLKDGNTASDSYQVDGATLTY